MNLFSQAEELCIAKVSEDIDLTIDVLPVADMDVDDDYGSLSANVLSLNGAKGDVASGTFTVINPNSTVQNVDAQDGPGNIRIEPLNISVSGLVKVGDPAVVIPSASVTVDPLVSLGSGEAQ